MKRGMKGFDPTYPGEAYSAHRSTLEPGWDKPAGPTPAQMARPVRATPEIAAKLQAARDARAGRTPSVKDTEQTSFSLRDYAAALESGPKAAADYRKQFIPSGYTPLAGEVWGPKTPGWSRLSKAAQEFLRGKPVKGPSQ